MDWIKTFAEKFESCENIKHLAADKFHGALTINFSDGIPHNCKLEQYFRIIKNQPKLQEVQ